MNMNQTTSPAHSQVETAHGLRQGILQNIIIIPCLMLSVRPVNSLLTPICHGRAPAEVKRDLAMGQAQYIRCMFRENQLTRRVRGTLQQTPDNGTNLSSSAVGGIQGQAERRPDLATLMVVNDAINQQISDPCCRIIFHTTRWSYLC